MPGPWTGDIQFTITDGTAGIVSVPSSTVQCVIGTSSGGTVGQVVPTQSLTTLQSTFASGPLMQAAGLALQAGGVVLAVKATASTPGAIQGTTVISGGVTGATTATPIVISVGSTATISTGSVVVVAAVGGNTAANGTWVVTVLSGTTFSLNASVGAGAYTSGGTVTPTGAIATVAGTAVPYFTGTPNDTIYPMVVCQTGFAVGTAGGSVLVSWDAGRTFGGPVAVGTATTIALADAGGQDSGLTLVLGVATKTWIGGGIVNGSPVGDRVRASTTEPLTNTTGVQAALLAIQTYLSGSNAVFPIIHVPGIWTAADASTIEGYLDTFATQYLFNRMLLPWRDVKTPLVWGGQLAETEATWLAALNADISATTAKRVVACGGYYNMPTAFPTAIAGSPIYRRPFSFALAARQIAIAPQRHAGKAGGVQGGSLVQIVRNPVTDPTDGFVYHDEYLTPSLDYFLPGGVGRFATARTRARKQGFFAADPLTLAPANSDFTLLPRALVMDVACVVSHDALEQFADADLTTNSNGTLSDPAAKTIWEAVYSSLQDAMTSVGMISGFTVVVNQTQNIQITQTLQVTITILGVAYVLQIGVNIGYANALSAQPVSP